METQKELDERTIREGKKHVTGIELTVTKDGEDYIIGDVMAKRVEHELGDNYLWGSESGELWIAAAKIRKCSINVAYSHETYILDENVFSIITDVEVEELPND